VASMAIEQCSDATRRPCRNSAYGGNFVAVSGRSGKSDKTARRRLGSQPRAPGLHSSRQTDPGHTTIIDRIGELDAKALHILAVVFAMLVRMPRRG
jgi:hypothetical protein